jgi:hypothetical protein
VIEDTIHIAGVKNIRCDQLSRGKCSPEDLGFKAEQIVVHPFLDKVNIFCNPITVGTDEDQASTMWKELKRIFSLINI